MLQKSFNKQRTTWLAFTVLPLLVALIFSFCNRVEKQATQPTTVDTKTDTGLEGQARQQQEDSMGAGGQVTEVRPLVEQSPQTDVKRFPAPKVVRVAPEGPGATAAELAEYEAIVKEMKLGENRYRQIEGKSNRVYPLYEKMTAQQRTDASQLPPPPPQAPTITVERSVPPKIVEKAVAPPSEERPD